MSYNYNYGPGPRFGPNDILRRLGPKVVQMTFFERKIGPNEKNHQNLLFFTKNTTNFKNFKSRFLIENLKLTEKLVLKKSGF